MGWASSRLAGEMHIKPVSVTVCLKPRKTKVSQFPRFCVSLWGLVLRLWSDMDDKDSWDSLSEFTLAEILEMENIYKDIGEEALNTEFCQRLASNFSCSSNRMGKSAVTWQQVQIWFQEKLLKTQTKQVPSPMALKLFVDLSDANSNKPPEIFQRRKGTVEDIKELSFEARSSKDFAWYDVESFLSYRVLITGEVEVRVRFTGFDYREDEWVNVETAVRERSIPLEPSECHMVKIGDLVLCFQDREDYQVYFDAHVVDIQRNSHDARGGCTCIFLVCYDHDYSEENVSLERLCRRPM